MKDKLTDNDMSSKTHKQTVDLTCSIDTNLNRFPHYMHMQIATKAASTEYNAAARLLDLAYINERNAELASQSFDSVAKGKLRESLGELTDREREIGIAFARYATYGRSDKA